MIDFEEADVLRIGPPITCKYNLAITCKHNLIHVYTVLQEHLFTFCYHRIASRLFVE